MKTYRSRRYHFEIDVPAEWPLPALDAAGDLRFSLPEGEFFSIHVNPPGAPEPPEESEFLFRKEARKRGYVYLEMGRITARGRAHFTVRYKAGELWQRAYLLAFGGASYTLTAACRDAVTLAAREPLLENIARSFRRIPAHPLAYDEAARRWAGPTGTLRLEQAAILDGPYLSDLTLTYAWDAPLADEEAERLCQRAISFLACAIYDAARAAGMDCLATETVRTARPGWLVEGVEQPVTVAMSQIHYERRALEVDIGAEEPGENGRARVLPLERIKAGFQVLFAEIAV